MSGQLRRRRRDERGSFTLELAVLFPVVLLLIFLVIQGALYYHARNVALAAAQEGVRVARAENGTQTAGGNAARAFVEQAGGTGIITNLKVDPTRTATKATITVSGRAMSAIPGMPGFTITQTAEGPVERFTSAGGGP